MSLEVVRSAKSDLEARGEDLSGPCGAFKIVKLVAWRLRDQGYGLHKKEYGNNCDGYSTDYVVGPDLHGYDILVDAGGRNEPTWNDDGPAVDGAWMAPVEVQDGPGDPTEPGPDPEPSPNLEARVAALEMVIEQWPEVLSYIGQRLGAIEDDLQLVMAELEVALEELAKPLTVTGSTGRTTWHTHSVNLEVKRG